jgi:hypothetical protein
MKMISLQEDLSGHNCFDDGMMMNEWKPVAVIVQLALWQNRVVFLAMHRGMADVCLYTNPVELH